MTNLIDRIYKCSHYYATTHYQEFNDLLSKITLFNQRKITHHLEMQDAKQKGAEKDSSFYMIKHMQEKQINKGYQQILEKFSSLMMEINMQLKKEQENKAIQYNKHITWKKTESKITLLYKNKPFPIHIVTTEEGYTMGNRHSIYYKQKIIKSEATIEKAKEEAVNFFWEEVANILLQKIGNNE